jgi:hypothetical protein
MTFSQIARRLGVLVTAALMTTAALAEDMSLPGPSGDCLSRTTAQLSIDTATCAGRYPVSTQLYGQCITRAHLAYAGNIAFCQNISGAKLSALRANEARIAKTGTLNRL